MPVRTRKGSGKGGSSTANKGGRVTTSSTASVTNALRVTKRTTSASSESRAGSSTEQQSFLQQYSQLDVENDEENNLRFFFVLPEGTTIATCLPVLSAAFLLCEEYPLRCKWITEKNCLKYEPQAGNIFVVAPFDGPAFSYLENCRRTLQNFEVVGPQCIKYALVPNMDVSITNRGAPPYTMSMRNLLVTLTGIPEAEKKELSKKIRWMNGAISSVFSQACTHVVAANILSVKCAVAYSNGIPVMTTKWVNAVWENSQVDLLHATDATYAKYTCPIFHSLNVCVSQVSLDMKSILKNAIESNGGKYCGELVRNKTDILVIPTSGGDKFHYAQQWKLPCVTPDWVDASKSAGHVLPVKDFEVPMLAAKTSTPKNSKTVPLGVSNISMLSQINVTGTNRNNIENLTLHTLNSQFQLNAEGLSILREAASRGFYLDGCRIFISGSHLSEQLRKLLTSSAAVCLYRLNENITHFLVTEQKIPEAELETLRRLDPRPHIITLEWLLESAKAGNLADEDMYAFDISPKKQVLKNSSRETSNDSDKTIEKERTNFFEIKSNELESRKPSKPNNASEDRVSVVQVDETAQSSTISSFDDVPVEVVPIEIQPIEFAVPVHLRETSISQTRNHRQCLNVSNVENRTSGTSDDNEDPCESGNSIGSEVLNPFTGMRIKVAIENEEEKRELQNLIEDGNGEVVDDDFSVLILPPVYPSDYPVSPLVKCLTKQWVYDNSDKSASGFHITETYFHKALPAFDEMSEIMNDVVIAISHYSNLEKEYLSFLVSSMGGVYQDGFVRKSSQRGNAIKRTTHLICPVTDNEKYRAAKKWGTPVVVADWILDCFRKKQCMTELPYSPELRIDTESTINYMPRTPKDVGGKSNTKRNRNGTGSIISNFLPSAEKKPADPTTVDHLKDPNDGGDLEPNDDSFQAWVDAGEHLKHRGKPPSEVSKSFIEWEKKRKAERKAERKDSSTSGDDDPVAGEVKISKRDARALRDALKWIGSNSPAPAMVDIKRRNSTPKSVMMARTWEKILEKFPIENHAMTSTPINSMDDSTGSRRQRETDDSIRMGGSFKRSSDSSIEDEAVGAQKLKKKMRFSDSDSDSDPSEVFEQDPPNVGFVSSNDDGEVSIPEQQLISCGEEESTEMDLFNNVVVWISKDCPEYSSLVSIVEKGGGSLVQDVMDASVTHLVIENDNAVVLKASLRRPVIKIVRSSWIIACQNEMALVHENMHKPITSVASSKSSMQMLNSLLADDQDGENVHGIRKSQHFGAGGSKKKSSDNLNRSDDKINPEELDAPHVVWDANEEIANDAVSVEVPKIEKLSNKISSRTTRSTRSTSCSSKDAHQSTKTSASKQAQRKGSKSKFSSENVQDQGPPENITNVELCVDVPRNPIFLLSGVNETEKATATEIITALGGHLSTAAGYDQAAFAIISGTLGRSEKVLGCVGAGKALLTMSYLYECRNAGKLLPLTEKFIWTQKEGMSSTEKDIANAAFMWFTRGLKNSEDKPMINMKFYLVESMAAKRLAYSRLIQASGGQVVSTPNDATFILSDGKNSSASKFDPAIVKHPLLLNQIILFDKTG